jgi:hypothetical protein
MYMQINYKLQVEVEVEVEVEGNLVKVRRGEGNDKKSMLHTLS